MCRRRRPKVAFWGMSPGLSSPATLGSCAARAAAISVTRGGNESWKLPERSNHIHSWPGTPQIVQAVYRNIVPRQTPQPSNAIAARRSIATHRRSPGSHQLGLAAQASVVLGRAATDGLLANSAEGANLRSPSTAISIHRPNTSPHRSYQTPYPN